MRTVVLFRVAMCFGSVFALLLFVSLFTTPLSANAGLQTAAASEKAPGSLTGRIKPPTARDAGARWRVDGGAWHEGGDTVSGLSPGDHTVSYKDVYGWQTPSPKQVSILANQETGQMAKYRLDQLVLTLPGDFHTLTMTWIPGGSFMMGRYSNEVASESDESPQHQVTFADGFWLGKSELTKAQWSAVVCSDEYGAVVSPAEREYRYGDPCGVCIVG